MQREVREAYQMLFASGTVLDVLAYRPTAGGGRQNLRIVYKCNDASATASGLRQCTRYEKPVATPASASDVANPGTVPAGSSAEMVIDRAQNGTSTDPVFTDGSGTAAAYSGSGTAPTYLAVAIKVPQKGEYAGGNAASFIFNGGLFFRNLDAKTPGP
jgi:hypothetical protein